MYRYDNEHLLYLYSAVRVSNFEFDVVQPPPCKFLPNELFYLPNMETVSYTHLTLPTIYSV